MLVFVDVAGLGCAGIGIIVGPRCVSTSSRAGAQIPHLPLGDDSSSGGDNPVCMYTYTVYTAVCNKSLTSTYQCKTQIPSNKLLANNIVNNN
jgi:hypothetical protein